MANIRVTPKKKRRANTTSTLSVDDRIKERVISVSKYIIDTGCTIREAAKVFGVCKSTIHKDCTVGLKELGNKELEQQVADVIEHHKQVRHIRGGEATRRKYEQAAKQHRTAKDKDNQAPKRCKRKKAKQMHSKKSTGGNS